MDGDANVEPKKKQNVYLKTAAYTNVRYSVSYVIHNQQFVSWVYLYPITAAAENTLISMGNPFSTCVFFESKTNRTS